jgi:hypothetical protein
LYSQGVLVEKHVPNMAITIHREKTLAHFNSLLFLEIALHYIFSKALWQASSDIKIFRLPLSFYQLC